MVVDIESYSLSVCRDHGLDTGLESVMRIKELILGNAMGLASQMCKEDPSHYRQFVDTVTKLLELHYESVAVSACGMDPICKGRILEYDGRRLFLCAQYGTQEKGEPPALDIYGIGQKHADKGLWKLPDSDEKLGHMIDEGIVRDGEPVFIFDEKTNPLRQAEEEYMKNWEALPKGAKEDIIKLVKTLVKYPELVQ